MRAWLAWTLSAAPVAAFYVFMVGFPDSFASVARRSTTLDAWAIMGLLGVLHVGLIAASPKLVGVWAGHVAGLAVGAAINYWTVVAPNKCTGSCFEGPQHELGLYLLILVAFYGGLLGNIVGTLGRLAFEWFRRLPEAA